MGVCDVTSYLKYVFLALLLFFSAVHLVESWRDSGKHRALTKPFLVPLILCYYLFSVDKPSWLLIAALVTSWLGDVLLIPGGKAYFISGGLSFAAAHVFFIFLYAASVDFATVKLLIALPAALVYLAVIGWEFTMLRRYLDSFMKFGMIFYLLVNAAMNLFALMQLMTHPGLGAALAYIGAILFFCSDVILFLVRFHENKNLVFKRHFMIMFTYILAEFLITQGMLLLGK